YVESISFNNTTMNGVQATNNATNGQVQPTNSNEAVMDINGTLVFNVPADPPTTTGAGGSAAGGSNGSVAAAPGTRTRGGLPTHIAGEYLWQSGASNDTTLATLLANTHGLNYVSWFEACGLNDGSGHLQLAGTYAGMASEIANFEASGGHVTLGIGGSNSDP